MISYISNFMLFSQQTTSSSSSSTSNSKTNLKTDQKQNLVAETRLYRIHVDGHFTHIKRKAAESEVTEPGAPGSLARPN